MEGRTNLAGRAGHWSAAHWKTATFGFVGISIAALVIGMALGRVVLTDSEQASGETAKAESILQNAGFNTPATESVLVQSKTETVDSDAFSSAVAGVVQTISDLQNVRNIQNPLDSNQNGLISKDRHSALIQFDIAGKARNADT